jgi:hypothetical protein
MVGQSERSMVATSAPASQSPIGTVVQIRAHILAARW